MYPGKLLSLANKGWGWAPLLKHVGFEWKKSEVHVKKKRITRKVVRILEQSKWRSKDQNSKDSKSWRYQKNQTKKVVNSKKSKIKVSKKWRIPKSSIVVPKSCNCLDYVCLGCSTKNTLRLGDFLRMDSEGCIKWALFGKSGWVFMRIVSIWSIGGY